MASNNNQTHKIFKEEDLEEIMRHVLVSRGFSIDKVTRRIFLELAQTFIEEILDLPPSQKMTLNKEVIARQILMKFPEIAKGDPNVEIVHRRNMEIEKEDNF